MTGQAADLTPQQRSLAEYVLEHLTTVPFLSVPELARTRRSLRGDRRPLRPATRLSRIFGTQDGVGRDPPGPPESGDDDKDDGGHRRRYLLFGGSTSKCRTSAARWTPLIGRLFAEVAEALFRTTDGLYFRDGRLGPPRRPRCLHPAAGRGLRPHNLSTRFSSPLEQLVAATPQATS